MAQQGLDVYPHRPSVKPTDGPEMVQRTWLVIGRAPTTRAGEFTKDLNLSADFKPLCLSSGVICGRIACRKAARDGPNVEKLKPGGSLEEVRTLFQTGARPWC